VTQSAREQRVAARLRELARDRRALRLALEQFADADAFARVWASDDPAEINRRDQVERPYERIVNDLQEIIDFCEAEETERGLPGPSREGDDEPGRWRRAALRGHLSHAQAERMQRIAWGRQRFQHHYADLPSRHGGEVFERAHELLHELPRAMRGLGRWISALWPPREV
jgi:hypothetical protein